MQCAVRHDNQVPVAKASLNGLKKRLVEIGQATPGSVEQLARVTPHAAASEAQRVDLEAELGDGRLNFVFESQVGDDLHLLVGHQEGE